MEGPWSAQGHGREHDSVLGGTGPLERTGAWGAGVWEGAGTCEGA